MPKALVLGGKTGLLGQSLMRVLSSLGWETQSLGREDGDILNFDFLKAGLEKANADFIFNTVAWTQVDAAEDHPKEAFEVNRGLPDALARLIASSQGHLIHYSTDFVFSGPHTGPWKESDTPNPDSVYGASKLAGEQAIMGILPERACILRTAWLFGPGRKNFVETIINACGKREVLTVIDDQIGSPTYSVDLAIWSSLLAEQRAYGIWHAVNSGRASWCELAAEAVQLASGPCRVVPIPSSEWPQKAKRPANSVLDNSKLASFLGKKPRPWPQALRDYLYGDGYVLQQEMPS